MASVVLSHLAFLYLCDADLETQASELGDQGSHLAPVHLFASIGKIVVESYDLKLIIHRLSSLDVGIGMAVIATMTMVAREHAEMALRFWADLARKAIKDKQMILDWVHFDKTNLDCRKQ